MTDRNALSDQNETPEDVATLYSWANLHGAKYRDFSASRAQTREKARQRVQEAIDADRHRAREEAEAAAAAEAVRAAEAARQAELAAQAAARQRELAVQQAAQEAARQAAQLAAQQAAEQAAQLAAQQAAEQAAARQAEIAAQEAAQEAAQQRAWQQSRFTAPPAESPAPADAQYYPQQPQQSDYPGYSPPQSYRPAPGLPQYAPVREESSMQPRLPWAPPDPRESAGRPAWLTQERGDISGQPASQAPLPQAPEDTLQGSRDRLTSRWFALKSIFEGDQAPVEAVPAPMPTRAPALAVFSLAGGVGKTSLVATLGRALSARGERVLLVDTAAFGLLPFFFGARDQRSGLLRTFSPPGASGDAPIQMVAIDPEALGPESAGQEALTAEIAKYSRGASRVIIDLATASGATTRKVMRMAPLVLVPVIPDMNSVVSVSSIDAFFQHNASAGKPVLPYYVLNQFDPSLPLHLDVREVLREQLGDRLLPFALRRAHAMSEALAEGMTVMDYAPNSTVAEDFGSLAGWVKGLSAPASSSYRGVRWSER
ncbi:MAG: cellulose synthase operon protein YhjQ/BcsQ [Terracidiphilus sp.]|jgi:cellulose synthase operon protein YhjQ